MQAIAFSTCFFTRFIRRCASQRAAAFYRACGPAGFVHAFGSRAALLPGWLVATVQPMLLCCALVFRASEGVLLRK